MLNDGVGEGVGGGRHELLHEDRGLVEAHTGLLETKVKGVIPDGLGVGAHATRASANGTLGHTTQGDSLEDDGEGARGVKTTAGNVEVELADRDAHSSETKVAKTENARAVGHDNDLGLVLQGGSVLRKDGRELVLAAMSAKASGAGRCEVVAASTCGAQTHLVLDREIETLRSAIDMGILLACLTNGGGVDDRGTGLVVSGALSGSDRLGSYPAPLIDSQVDKIGLDGGEEELGVLLADTRKETVLVKRRWGVAELLLETEERLLAGDLRTGEGDTAAKS